MFKYFRFINKIVNIKIILKYMNIEYKLIFIFNLYIIISADGYFSVFDIRKKDVYARSDNLDDELLSITLVKVYIIIFFLIIKNKYIILLILFFFFFFFFLKKKKKKIFFFF